MDNTEFKKEVVYIYTKFRRKYGDSPNYALRYGERESTLLGNFILLLTDSYGINSIGSEFLVDFFYFHFSFWFNSNPKFSRIPYLNWCVGDKGFKRWRNRGVNWRYFAKKNLGDLPEDIRYSIATTGSATKEVNKKAASQNLFVNFKEEQFLKINEFEEKHKRVLYGTEEGFINCTLMTTLYNRKSKYCIKCKFAKNCKKTLKEMYPEIAKARGYEEIK